MIKSIFAFIILLLILSTALIKNSTKKIDDEIFSIKENISSLKNDFENAKLEYDYLSSAEKLLEFRNLYFDDQFIKKNISSIGVVNKTTNGLKIKKFRFINER